MFNDFQWCCFNLVDMCNIALILFLKCDVTKFRIPLTPLVTQCHTMSHFVDPSAPPLNVWRNLRMPPIQFVTFVQHIICLFYQYLLIHINMIIKVVNMLILRSINYFCYIESNVCTEYRVKRALLYFVTLLLWAPKPSVIEYSKIGGWKTNLKFTN